MTAYLKAHYKVEFMAALLSSDITGRNFKRKDSLVEHIEDCQRMDIAVLPPDVNRSGAEFTVSEGKICFGLSAIKGCGAAAANARRPNAPPTDRIAACSISASGSTPARSIAPPSKRSSRPGRSIRSALADRSCSRGSIGPCRPGPPPPRIAAAAS